MLVELTKPKCPVFQLIDDGASSIVESNLALKQEVGFEVKRAAMLKYDLVVAAAVLVYTLHHLLHQPC